MADVYNLYNKYIYLNGKWEVLGGDTSTVSELNDLSDVTVTDPKENQIFQYDGGKWANADHNEITEKEIDDLLYAVFG